MATGAFFLVLATSMAVASAAGPPQASVHVPFVGCESGGQVGFDAPKGATPKLRLTSDQAPRLAFYKAKNGPGVLAPRGWYCFGEAGSGGSALFVSPEPIAHGHSKAWKGFPGWAIVLSTRYGGTAGRFGVAQMIARVFPAHMKFALRVMNEDPDSAKDYPRGPYPKDKLTYKSQEIVEYETPPWSKGLGANAYSDLRQNEYPIRGVAILKGPDTDLLLLGVRVPPELSDLVPTIIQQVERAASPTPRDR
jgi:hypothetical protein